MLGSGKRPKPSTRFLLSLDPTHLEARLQLSGLYAQRDKLASALRVCQEALAHSPPDSALYRIYFTLGHLYHAQGRIEEAEAALERTLALEPAHAQAYNNLGNLHLEKNDLQQAATAYQQALAVAPDFAEAHYNLGRLYAQQKVWAKAVRQYQAPCVRILPTPERTMPLARSTKRRRNPAKPSARTSISSRSGGAIPA